MQGAAAALAEPLPSSSLPVAGSVAADQNAGSLEADDLAQKIAAAREASNAAPVLVETQEPSSSEGRSGSISTPSGLPIPGVRLSSNYGMRMHPILGTWTEHHGVDLAAPTGTPVCATADGTISLAEWAGNYGFMVKIDHGGHMETRYGHLSALGVVKGRRVRKGDVIGFVGSTGRSTGPHLHYEVRIAGSSVDPIPFLSPRAAEYAPDRQRGSK